MPEISRFYGVVIRMYCSDHNPPHFHAFYGGRQARIDIQALAAFAGRLPPRALGLVIEWASIHQEELMEIWELARNNQPLRRIDPLP
jgi:hypothetical protein